MKRFNLFTLLTINIIAGCFLFQTSSTAQEVKKTKEIILITEEGDIDDDDLKTFSFSIIDDEFAGENLIQFTLNNDFSDSSINALKEKLLKHGVDIDVSKDNDFVKIFINSDTLNLSGESRTKVIKRIKNCDGDSTTQLKYIVSDDKDGKKIIENELIFDEFLVTAVSSKGCYKNLILKYCFDSKDDSDIGKRIKKKIKSLNLMSLAEKDSCLSFVLKCDENGVERIETIELKIEKDCDGKTFHIYSSDDEEINLDGNCKIIIYDDEDCKSKIEIYVTDDEPDDAIKDLDKKRKRKDKKKKAAKTE
ncbi:MAG: hypothetical protein JEY97_05060 [Bacteroidales bacterium]|nr:hypothetical protein [Bacteroidales bacterium]